MIEIELKFLVSQNQIAGLSTKLMGLGFVLNKPRTYEISVMHDNKQGAMQRTDGRIRLRRSGNNEVNLLTSTVVGVV